MKRKMAHKSYSRNIFRKAIQLRQIFIFKTTEPVVNNEPVTIKAFNTKHTLSNI